MTFMIADRMIVPDNTSAILWDMDGTLLDTLTLDLTCCNQLLQEIFGEHVTVSKDLIRSLFAYHPPEFWRRIIDSAKKEYGISCTDDQYQMILRRYDDIRNNSIFEVNPGVREILDDSRKRNLKSAVVSNNPTADVKRILSLSGILDYFDPVVGNDIRDFEKKPAPDTYVYAMEILGVSPGNCVVVEDSVLGAEAGHRANCYTIGVATGGESYKSLRWSPWTDCVHTSFERNAVDLRFGNVTRKKIETPNEFVSHMVEHIAWRLCCEIDLHWNNCDWSKLGEMLGRRIREFEPKCNSAAALGMIDDGSAEVVIRLSEKPLLELNTIKNENLDWFLSSRCEQLTSGQPLVDMAEGLAYGLGAEIIVRICGVTDPHHTWEGIFRSIGIALNKIFTPISQKTGFEPGEIERNVTTGDVRVEARSASYAKVVRRTAETEVSVSVDFSQKEETAFDFDVSHSIDVGGLPILLKRLVGEAGFSLRVDFKAAFLSSSHVVLEDTALVLGRALKEILILRMGNVGVNGAGSSIRTEDEFRRQPVRVGVSVEGRKFWKIIPFEMSDDDLKKQFIIGQDVCDGLFSEDLDDFLDGLSGGLGCSIIVHVKNLLEADSAWRMVFGHLGRALKEVFEANPYRKGVPPGVKATLA